MNNLINIIKYLIMIIVASSGLGIITQLYSLYDTYNKYVIIFAFTQLIIYVILFVSFSPFIATLIIIILRIIVDYSIKYRSDEDRMEDTESAIDKDKDVSLESSINN